MPGTALTTAIVWTVLRRRPVRVAVEGTSMAPTLLPGDWALAVAGGRLRRGDVVVVQHPDRPNYEMVKRITALPGDGDGVGRRGILAADELWVEGDHAAASTDSRELGPVRRTHVKARVLLVYRPWERRRWLPRLRMS